MSRQGDYNRSVGLPENWRPMEHLGPARRSPIGVTPGGIRVDHQGFRRADIPEKKKEVLARVVLPELDRIWLEVRKKYHAENLTNDWPRLTIWPTIQWSEQRGFYLGGVCTSVRDACATVWYRSVTGARLIANWQGYVWHEFGHLCVGPWIEPEMAGAQGGLFTQVEP